MGRGIQGAHEDLWGSRVHWEVVGSVLLVLGGLQSEARVAALWEPFRNTKCGAGAEEANWIKLPPTPQ